MRHVSLFTGIGGIDLAAEWAGFTTIAQVECDPYCLAVLAKHWPDVPRCDDIRRFPDRDYGAVTLVSGGFPCQPFSCAGKRRGQEDHRNLWPEMARVIRQLKPAWVCAENTAGAVHLVLDRALADLEEAGYSATALVLPALAVGAWHERQRLFILAHLSKQRRPGKGDRRQQILADFPREAQPICPGSDGGVAQSASDSEGWRREGREVSARSRPEGERAADVMRDSADAPEAGSALLQLCPAEAESAWRNEPRAREWWETERGLVRVVYGLPRWLDRHRRRRVAALGNSCIPVQVYPILQAIADTMRRE